MRRCARWEAATGTASAGAMTCRGARAAWMAAGRAATRRRRTDDTHTTHTHSHIYTNTHTYDDWTAGDDVARVGRRTDHSAVVRFVKPGRRRWCFCYLCRARIKNGFPGVSSVCSLVEESARLSLRSRLVHRSDACALTAQILHDVVLCHVQQAGMSSESAGVQIASSLFLRM